MKIIEIKIMRGPNYWSNYRKKLIVMKLDLEEMEYYPSNKIDGFNERLEKMIPSLYLHHCSEGKEGGFLERLEEGTWMGHVVEHVALEMQTLAGMDCGYGRTRSTGQTGVYHVVFEYEKENAGTYAAGAAVKLVEAIINNEPYNIDDDIRHLEKINRRESLGPSTGSILREAERQGIPCQRLNDKSLIMLGHGCNQKLIEATVADTTSGIGVDLAADKEGTKKLLEEACIPVPHGRVVSHPEDLEEAIDEIGFPCVIKPINGNHGRGITTNINSFEQANAAFEIASKISPDVIVETFVKGFDFRFLVINYKLVAVAKRTPAKVTGDGQSTIQQLINKANKDPRRGDGHENVMTRIKVDDTTKNILANQGLTVESVLPGGEILYLKDTANMSTGGTSTDVTDMVHPRNVFMAERIARLMHLDICGIDVVTENVNVPITDRNGAIVEVNAGPGFRMHLSPTNGSPRNVAEPVIKMLFPKGAHSARIPVVAITGTNGKTTTTRLVAHIAKTAGRSVGFTTTEGVYINEHPVCYGDCSGPTSAKVVLRDPVVDYAVLECARGGILRTGLGFDHCSISIVTNVTEDHLGLNDIETLDDLAEVKSVVPRSTLKDGYAILNADDDLVYNMKDIVDCNVAFFSLKANNQRIREHVNNGGLAAVVEDGYFVVYKGVRGIQIARIEDVPLTLGGQSECMVANVLPAILSAVISNFGTEQLRTALYSFIPSPEFTPGRFNEFKFGDFKLMIDYVHNEAGFIEMEKYVKKVNASRKVFIMSATGDRREEDIRKIGHYAARIFDEMIITHDTDGRGRSNDELTSLISEGIQRVNPNMKYMVISDQFEAMQYAMENAVKGAFIFVSADEVLKSIEFIREAQRLDGIVQKFEDVKKAS